jgi:hypothetical protein
MPAGDAIVAGCPPASPLIVDFRCDPIALRFVDSELNCFRDSIDCETKLNHARPNWIQHVVGREGAEVVGYVGTNDPIAKYHELGTRTIPPRSFLGEAAMRQEHKNHATMERTIAVTLDRGGPHYREIRELFHVLHMAYEQGKKLADEFLEEDE